MKPGENPPVGLILCAEKGAAEAHYALDNLPNKVLAAEYQTVLPTKSSSPRNLNAPAGTWSNVPLSAELPENRLILTAEGKHDD